jgi:glucose/arabinose dehydrogenase
VSARQAIGACAVVVVMVATACSADDAPSDADGSTQATFATVPPLDTTDAPVTPTAPPASTPPTGTAAPTAATDTVTSTAPATPSPAPLAEPAVELLEIGQFDQPVEIAIRPLDNRLFIVQQTGQVVAVDDESTEVVLDVSELISAGGEQGLLGLAFHPTEKLAYVNYTDRSGDTVVAEYVVDPTTGTLEPSTVREILKVEQPFANHNGGKVAFGPDRLLYIGLGDGGSADDPDRSGLDLTTPLGKILRIDPAAAGAEPYTVPPDNPFVGADGADPRIWSLGLRNPWRFSFDAATGDLWIADVGQNEFEEINRAPASGGVDAGRGLSFGWSAFEGNDRFNDDQSDAGHTAPVYVYSHDGGRCSVSGGAVARDSKVPDLNGWYVFGDYCSGEIWALDPAAASDAPRVVMIGSLPALASISTGADGDLYAISNAGTIARFVTP